jgi:hypothetical protein
MTLEQRLRKLSRISDLALLGTDGFFYVFGKPGTGVGCLYADGNLTKSVKQEAVVLTRNQSPDDKRTVNTKENIDYLVSKAIKIHSIKFDEPIISFTLTAAKWEIINKRIRDEDATHFQLECNGIEIRAYFYDVRSTIGSSNFKPSWISGANGLYLRAGHKQFRFSIDASAWKRLPISNVVIKVFNNGILRMDYIDEGFRVNIRDQLARRPHLGFFSKRLEKRVLMLFHPKNGTMVNLEKEFIDH